MATRRLFPASVVDELSYSVEGVASGLHFVYAWIVTLEGEVSTDVTHRALDRAFNYYPKYHSKFGFRPITTSHYDNRTIPKGSRNYKLNPSTGTNGTQIHE